MSSRTSLLERLERRRLLAVVTSNLDVWTITGSDAGESITVNLRASDQRLRAVVDGKVIATRLLKHVRLIEVLGNGGNDVIKIDLHDRNSKLMVWCNGGAGRDWLLGGATNENLGGGSGNDVVDGGRGDDIVKGGTGNDDVTGGDGNDYCQGNGGHDTLTGGWGDDRMTGGKGRDQLRGGAGADQLVGGKDNDVLKGGGGADLLAAGGGVGNVVYRQDNDVDEVLAGATDTLDVDDVDEPLTRMQTTAELRAWLIDRAVAQWKQQLGKPQQELWGWYDGAIVTATSTGGLASALGSGTASPQDVSQTNTQEEGVDEADLVETDGQYLYVLHQGELLIIDADPAADLKIVSHTAFEETPTGMFLDGDRLTVISQTFGSYHWWGTGGIMAFNSSFAPGGTPKTIVTVFDIADRAAPAKISETSFEGSLNASRVIDGRLYLAHTGYLNVPPPKVFEKGEGEFFYQTEAEYRAYLADGEIDKILPKYTTTAAGGGGGGQILATPDVYVRDGERLDSTTVTLIDLRADDPAPISSTSIIGANGTAYASKHNLYLAGYNFDGSAQSEVLKFGLGIDQVSLQASGRVDGAVLNQFSMDEEGEYFRVASSDRGGADEAGSRVSVFDQVGDELVLVGKVEDLAKGERIFSARFIGDRAYVVTFRNVDPLFVIDLSDPAAPAVKGELKIPGFSNYLQPVGENLIVGVGRDATEEGLADESQVSLFDVSDAANPTRVDTFDLGDNSSLAASDHHAFSYFPEQGLLALPAGDSGGTLQLLKVNRSGGFTDAGRIEHDQSVFRSVRIGANVFSIGGDAIRVHELANPENEIDALDLPQLFPGSGVEDGGGGVIISRAG